MQHEAHRVGIDDLDFLDLLVEFRPLRALEAELYVLGGERVAVMEFQVFAQLEFVREVIRALRPGFREARRHGIAGHRFHQRVMQPIGEPERMKGNLG